MFADVVERLLHRAIDGQAESRREVAGDSRHLQLHLDARVLGEFVRRAAPRGRKPELVKFARAEVLGDAAADLQAVDARHHDVEQHEVGDVCAEEGQSLLGAFRKGDLESRAPQLAREQVAVERVVVHHQQARRSRRGRSLVHRGVAFPGHWVRLGTRGIWPRHAGLSWKNPWCSERGGHWNGLMCGRRAGLHEGRISLS